MRPSVLIRYLQMPLRSASLLLIVSFGLLLTLAEHAGVLGIPAFGIVGSWFFKYGFVLLDDAAEGRREPPVLSMEMANPFEQRPLGLFLLLVLFYFVTAALKPYLGDAAVTVLRLLLLAMVPAMVASMSMTGRFIDALNPVVVVGTTIRIPLAYATLLVEIFVVWFIAVWMLQPLLHSLLGLWRAESFLPGQVASAIGSQAMLTGLLGLMLSMYLWLATFACIGGMIFEHRAELGIDVAESPERTAARANAEVERQRDKIMDVVFGEMRSGSMANASATVRKLIEQAPQPLEACRWIYQRAAAAVDQRLADYVAQLTLPPLLETRATGEALMMARQRVAVNPDFRPYSASHLLQLVRLARDAGERILARQLVVDFSRHYPNDPLAGVAAELQTQLLSARPMVIPTNEKNK